MLLFFLFISISYAMPYNDYKLINKDFSAIINNGIILNNKYTIKYNSFLEDSKYKQIYFNEYQYNKDFSISTVSGTMNNIKFVHEITDNTTKFINNIRKISKYENNKLYVSIYINNWKFNDIYNDLDFEFTVDNSFFINNTTIGINNDFIIDFDEDCVIDGYNERIYLTKSNNKYKLHFPSFDNNLYYQFVISKNNNSDFFNNFIVSIIIILFGFYIIKFMYYN